MTDEKVDLASLSMEERVRVLRERAAKNRSQPAKLSAPKYDVKDFIDLDEYRTPEDDVIQGIDIIDAYVRYIGKMQPKVYGSQTESVKISCPLPGHTDANPSAWINTDKKVWHCGACETGGDIYDLAAIEMGLYPHYKRTAFPEVKSKLAADFGMVKVVGLKEDYYVPAEPDAKVIPIREDLPEEVDADFPEIFTGLSDPEQPTHIQWESLVDKDTFLEKWMNACTAETDQPHEYFLWQALLALGFVGGSQIVLGDTPNVKGNLYICLYGSTGLGKSRALKPLTDLILKTQPYDFSDVNEDPQGVKVVSAPASAEAMIDSFAAEVMDPTTGKMSHRAQIKGLLKIEEFLSFVSTAGRAGSNLRPIFIEMYDALNDDVTTHSRGSGDVRAHNPFCQVVTTTQPRAIHEFLRKTDAESGFLNRLLFIFGKPRREPIAYRGPVISIDDSLDAYRNLLVWAEAHPDHTYVLEGDALDAWQAFFYKEIAPFKRGDKELNPLQARIDLTLKKLIILFAINAKEEQPSASSVEKAVSLFPYLMTTYGMLAGDLARSQRNDCQEAIIHRIKDSIVAYGKGPSKGELVKHFKGRWTRDELVPALEMLLKSGDVEEAPTPPGSKGRPTVRYTVAD